MIEVGMTATQDGPHVKLVVAARTNDTTTPAEEREVELIIEAIQDWLTRNGSSGNFIERAV